jgi:hypothetical protein
MFTTKVIFAGIYMCIVKVYFVYIEKHRTITLSNSILLITYSLHHVHPPHHNSFASC